jgi:hypothetical protein
VLTPSQAVQIGHSLQHGAKRANANHGFVRPGVVLAAHQRTGGWRDEKKAIADIGSDPGRLEMKTVMQNRTGSRQNRSAKESPVLLRQLNLA